MMCQVHIKVAVNNILMHQPECNIIMAETTIITDWNAAINCLLLKAIPCLMCFLFLYMTLSNEYTHSCNTL